MAALLDALVVVAASWALSQALGRAWPSVAFRVGMALVALAALVGTARYAAVPSLAREHDAASTIATVVGMPLSLIGWLSQPGLRRGNRAWTARGLGAGGWAVIAFAALVVGDVGNWRGVPREMCFHAVFAVGVFLLGASLRATR